MKRVVFIALALLVCGTMVFAGGSKDSGKLKIGISLPTQREQRWVWDKEGFEAAAKKMPNVEIMIQIADNNAARQQSQCENLITKGAKILIVAPHDEGAAAAIAEMARKAGVPVIAYDRLIANGNVNLYVTFDQYKIGYLMGEYMAKNLDKGNIVFLKGDPGDSTCKYLAGGAKDAMKEKLDSGAFNIVLEQDCMDWEPREALKHMEQALTLANNDVQGVIAPNDGTAGGVIQALAAQGLAGKVLVTGQDCETDAVKRIIAGTQSMTVFFNCKEMSAAALEAAAKIARGEDPGANGTENDGANEVAVLQLPATQVTKDNYRQLLIDSKFFKESEFK
ncbi:MAG: substrate-binding domain-containing protein [Treponema sp.]|jgi:D-xylose transport system substrate-binding protein|nr:substrate-binding domain-containing protein [Treponema sp.]